MNVQEKVAEHKEAVARSGVTAAMTEAALGVLEASGALEYGQQVNPLVIEEMLIAALNARTGDVEKPLEHQQQTQIPPTPP